MKSLSTVLSIMILFGWVVLFQKPYELEFTKAIVYDVAVDDFGVWICDHNCGGLSKGKKMIFIPERMLLFIERVDTGDKEPIWQIGENKFEKFE